MVKVGLNAGIFAGQPSPADAVRLARAAGADGVELNLEEEGALSPATPEAELRAVRRAAEAEGTEVPSICSDLHWKYSLTDPDEAVRQRGMWAMERTLEAGAALGCRVHLLVPGAVTPRVRYAEAWARGTEAVARLARRAEALGMRIGVENVGNRFLLSPLEMARFIDEVGSPAVGAYFDVGNVLATGFPADWIQTLGRRLAAVHVKDRRRAGGQWVGVHLLQGDVPWADVTEALAAVGYDGFVTAELDPYRHWPERAAPDAVAAMRAILSRPAG